MTYFIIDIETCPLDLEKNFSLPEEERTSLLNPIDSRIIAIGIRHKNKNTLLYGEENEILEKFWEFWKKTKSIVTKPVGFNITSFDMPFIVTRSFINKVKIVPFSIKEIIDLREKLSAYKYGKVRGKLKEFAEIIGIKTLDVDGSDIAELWKEGKHEKIKEYLEKDLEITDEIYKRAKELNILEIKKWK